MSFRVPNRNDDVKVQHKHLLDTVNEMELKQQVNWMIESLHTYYSQWQKFKQEYEALMMVFSSIQQGDEEKDPLVSVNIPYFNLVHDFMCIS